MSAVATKDSIKFRIIRALLCAVGQHEPWERPNTWNGSTEVVRIDVESQMHDEVSFVRM